MGCIELKTNYHTHTSFCDGRNTAEEMVLRAIELGFETLGFSGHMDVHINMDMAAYMAELSRLQAVYGDRIEILRGVELDNMYDPHCADGTDYAIGSTHYLHHGDEYIPIDHNEETIRRLANEYYGGDYYVMAQDYYREEAQICDRINCAFIGHFDLITRFNDSMRVIDESDPRYIASALEAMEHLVRIGKPFEINCGAYNRGRKAELYPNRFLLKKLKEFGGEILINSDAHDVDHINAGFDKAVATAVECGFDHMLILTKRGTGKVHFEERALVN